MATTITNTEPHVITTMEDVQTFMTNNSIPITGSIELDIDDRGYVKELRTDATFTGPQIASFEDEFFHKRTQGDKGLDVASGSTVTLSEGNLFDITGTSSIDYITTTTWKKGSSIILRFDSALTVNHNTGSVPANTEAIFLAGSANQAFTANSTLTLVFDDVFWREIGRMIA
jgi:hypothetical protein